MHLLAKNILSLFVVQASVYLIPLITTPYLARTLGVSNFGLLGIVSAVMGYASLISDWGFGFTATREVARNATDLATLRKIYWNTVFAKALLCSCALAVFIGAASMISDWRKMLSILLVFSFVPITSVFNAGWFLQGLENIVGFARISLVSRILAIPLIFALVHSPEDVIVVASISGGIGLISAALSLFVANRSVPLFRLISTLEKLTNRSSPALQFFSLPAA